MEFVLVVVGALEILKSYQQCPLEQAMFKNLYILLMPYNFAVPPESKKDLKLAWVC